MRCRQCDTEIDDLALICFKCGAATTDPVHPPADVSPKRSVARPLLLGALFLVVAGFFVVQALGGEPTSPIVWLMLVSAGALLAWRLRLR